MPKMIFSTMSEKVLSEMSISEMVIFHISKMMISSKCRRITISLTYRGQILRCFNVTDTECTSKNQKTLKGTKTHEEEEGGPRLFTKSRQKWKESRQNSR
jgi:hypothetical protein